MIRIQQVRCPHCGNWNARHFDAGEWYGFDVMYCDDPSNNGCGKEFALRWNFEARMTTYKLTEPQDQ